MREAVDDDAFPAQLADDATRVLEDYDLTSEKRVALSSEDAHWIKDYVAKLDKRLDDLA